MASRACTLWIISRNQKGGLEWLWLYNTNETLYQSIPSKTYPLM